MTKSSQFGPVSEHQIKPQGSQHGPILAKSSVRLAPEIFRAPEQVGMALRYRSGGVADGEKISQI